MQNKLNLEQWNYSECPNDDHLWEWKAGTFDGKEANKELLGRAYFSAYKWCIQNAGVFDIDPYVNIERDNIVTTEIEFDSDLWACGDPEEGEDIFDNEDHTESPFDSEFPTEDEYSSGSSTSYPVYTIYVYLSGSAANEAFKQYVALFKLKYF